MEAKQLNKMKISIKIHDTKHSVELPDDANLDKYESRIRKKRLRSISKR